MTLLRLADFANDQGIAYPSVARMAHDLNKTTRAVQDDLAELRRRGEITEVGLVPGSRGVKVYRVEALMRSKTADRDVEGNAGPASAEDNFRGEDDEGRSELHGNPEESYAAPLKQTSYLTVRDPLVIRQPACVRSDFHNPVVELHAKLCMVLGIDPSTNERGLGDLRPIANWLCNEPEQAQKIEEIIRLRMSQKLSVEPDFLPSTWRYFDAAVREGLQVRAPQQAIDDFDPIVDQRISQDRARCKLWYESGKWQRELWGPPPGESGCCILQCVIKEFEKLYGGAGRKASGC